MVASTDIKFYVHTNNNAPQLQNAYGSMISVLDACLVSGIQLGTVSSLTASGTTITATFSTAHKLLQYQVIQVSGATQSEYNGQHRILSVPSATTITFSLAIAPAVSPATGAISASLPPLGWEKPFSATGKAAYRSANLLLPSRPFLRVVDALDPVWGSTYAKYAKVAIVENMTSIDTMLGVQAPYDPATPNKNWAGTGSGTSAYNGWAKWYYARAGATTAGYTQDSTAPVSAARNWILVGTGEHFYIINGTGSSDTMPIMYGFGAFDSAISTDSANTFLVASTSYVAASTPSSLPLVTGGSNDYSSSVILHRPYTQDPDFCTAFSVGLALSATEMFSGSEDNIAAASITGIVNFTPTILVETATKFDINPHVLRGSLPNIGWLYQKKPHADLSMFTKNNGCFIAKNIVSNAVDGGQIVLKIGDL